VSNGWPFGSRNPASRNSMTQHVRQHGLGQPSGECVLLARMIGDKQTRQSGAQRVIRAVFESIRRDRFQMPLIFQQREIRAHRHSSKRQHGARLEKFDFPCEVRAAVRELGRQRLVCRRSAPERGRDVRPVKLQTVISADRSRLVRKARPIERAIEKIPRSVAREHPAGPISPMCCGSKTENQQPRLFISESGYGLSPIVPFAIGSPPLPGHLFAIDHEPGTFPASHNLFIEFPERVGHGKSRRYHEPFASLKSSYGMSDTSRGLRGCAGRSRSLALLGWTSGD